MRSILAGWRDLNPWHCRPTTVTILQLTVLKRACWPIKIGSVSHGPQFWSKSGPKRFIHFLKWNLYFHGHLIDKQKSILTTFSDKLFNFLLLVFWPLIARESLLWPGNSAQHIPQSYCYLSDGLIVELKCGEEDKDGVLQLGVKGLVGQLPVHKDAEGGEGDTSGQPVRLLLARLQQHTNNLVLNTHTHK